jgi:NAD(P)-dependent dehydrogenase (short-subunit alcohol dehydrogenase family)
VWRVVQAVLPAMRANGSGRIITISSIGGLIGQPFNDAYCAAKFAVEGMMESLAPVARKFGIYLSLIEPGPVNTEFVPNVLKFVKEAPPEIHEPYAPLLDAYIKGTQQAFATMGQTGDDIGKIVVEAATTAAPHFRYLTSDLAQSLVSRKYVDTTGDSVVAISGSRLQ